MNMILLTVDCLRADYLGCLGPYKNTTPNIDRLTENGILFEQAVSVSTFTPASFIAMFTSTYPLMNKGELYVTNQRTTLSRVLEKHGFSTAAFHSNAWLSSLYGYHKGFDVFEDGMRRVSLRGNKIEGIARRLTGNAGGFYRVLAPLYQAATFSNPSIRADTLNKQALSWLDLRDGDFFLWLHYMDVHNPYLPRRRNGSIFSRYHYWKLNQKTFVGQSHLLPHELQELKELYMEQVIFIDEVIGQLVEQLKKRNIFDDTYIILTSDHGQQLMEHGHFGHTAYLYDEVIKVPLIICGPGLKSGLVKDQVSLLDVAPTILDILGIDVPGSYLGDSLVPLAIKDQAGITKTGRSETISETPYDKSILREMKTKPVMKTDQTRISLRTSKWKYIYRAGDKGELYDLENDPGEWVNLISEETAVAAQMYKKIEAHLDRVSSGVASEVKTLTQARVRSLKRDGMI